MPELKEITKENFDTDVLSSSGLLLVYYYTGWCKACQELEEDLTAAIGEVSDKMTVVQVDTDNEEEIITQQGILSIPMFQAFKDGTAVSKFKGKLSKLELLGELSGIVSEHGEDSSPEEAPDSADSASEADEATETENASSEESPE